MLHTCIRCVWVLNDLTIVESFENNPRRPAFKGISSTGSLKYVLGETRVSWFWSEREKMDIFRSLKTSPYKKIVKLARAKLDARPLEMG